MQAGSSTPSKKWTTPWLWLFQKANDKSYVKLAAAHDLVVQALNKTIRLGWPDSTSPLPEVVYYYLDACDELTVQDELVFKGPQLVIPSSLRK